MGVAATADPRRDIGLRPLFARCHHEPSFSVTRINATLESGPWRCNVDTIAVDLKVIWEMSAHIKLSDQRSDVPAFRTIALQPKMGESIIEFQWKRLKPNCLGRR